MFGHSSKSEDKQSEEPKIPDPAMTHEPPMLGSNPPTVKADPQPQDDNPITAPPLITNEPTVITPPNNQETNLSAEENKANSSSLNQTTKQDDLLDIKQDALQELAPLVDKLEQTPEEKFHLTMMMIQATDNKDLLSEAYKTAQTITDEKARAQALLDVINEINYFTQNQNE